MRRFVAVLSVIIALAVGFGVGLAPSPAQAAGPVDGELAVFWLDSDFQVEGPGPALMEPDASDIGIRGEVWFLKKFGASAAHFESNVEAVSTTTDSAEYDHLDVRYRIISPTEDNFIAIGVGWQNADLTVSPAFGETDGPRLSAEGRVGAGPVFGYGEVAWMPMMDDIQPVGGGTMLEDVEGMSMEIGVAFQPAPFTVVRLAYRDVDFDMVPVGGGPGMTVSTDGFMLGVGIRF